MATERDTSRDRTDASVSRDPDANPDPITGAPGSHPIGTGVGAAGGGAAAAATGALIGSAVPGIGTVVGGVVGAVVGAVAGGLAGKGVAESVNPTAEDAYWREQHKTRPYAKGDYTYDEDYGPAYRHGWESHSKHGGTRSFDDAEGDLQRDWDQAKGKSRLAWNDAKHAARDAWDRVGSERTGSAYGTGAASSSSSSSTGESARIREIRESSVNVAPRTGDNDLTGGHPAGTGIGAATGGVGGAAAGAALGTAMAPGPGTLIGGAIGAVGGAMVGGAAGQAVAEAVNPQAEDAYWRGSYASRPYYESTYTYDEDYAPAYRYGWESRTRYAGRRFEDTESDLSTGWERAKGNSRLTWEKAKHATRDAWHKVERAIPGDADRDGR